MRELCISVLTVWSAAAAVPPVIPGDSERGAKLFENERCVECHSVNGKGGNMGMDLSARVDRGFTPALLASAMWNHAPVMWAAMEGAGIERPKLSASDAADLFAYLYSTRFFDQPGDAARGKQAFADRHCADCHGITASNAEGAPPVVKWESLGQPMVLVQQMWDHSSSMREAFAHRKIAWQELTAQELSDILAYLRNLPETRGMDARFSFTTGEGGQAIFEAKGCVNCHVGKLALEDRLHNLALTEIAVDMWNHAPRMKQPVPQLSEDEMRQLLSYLWMRQFVYAKGDPARGKQVFAAKVCASCHAGGEHGAPPLPGQGRGYSEITIISALWKHGPQMFTRMRQAKMSWPRFNNPQQMSDLVAYLNSVQ
ncbi:MAG TPA: c-type cytochrome [Bryobacteraceae bacterium]|jgi:mono/diheme cytochrome c family protein|nr:c-type cytochrome [Bryobacteraceae bacterium]